MTTIMPVRSTPFSFVSSAACATALVSALAIATAALAGDWIVDASVGCRVWNPHPGPDETIRWSGACANGYAQGRGAAQWFRSNLPFESDEGEWREGRQIGYGTQVWPTGRYEGELLDGEPHGTGVLTLQGARYDGAFRNGRPNGAGTLSQGDVVYAGTWTDGCFRDGNRRAAFGVPLSSCR
jgi:MORN repeat